MIKTLLKKLVVSILNVQSRHVLKKHQPKIVAVTGSVGKTSTKDALKTILSASFDVRASQKSYNSEIGLPLTILGLENAWSNPLGWLLNIIKGFGVMFSGASYPAVLVLEIGADSPGDIRRSAQLFDADSVVLTWFPDVPVHVEFFDSPEAVIAEKMELVHALKPDGLLIVNADNEKMKQQTFPKWVDSVSIGFSKEADIIAKNNRIRYKQKKPVGTSFEIHAGEVRIPITISGAVSRSHVYPMLFAVAVGRHFGMNIDDVERIFDGHIATPGRMKIIEGLSDSTIIDDTYNSSPVAVEEALHTLETLKIPGKKIAVLGDMMELGSFSAEEHKRIGTLIHGKAEVLITVGVRARGIAEAAKIPRSNIHMTADAMEAADLLEEILEKEDVVLVKGSQSIRLEKVVEKVMRHPDSARDLLVRQDAAWKNR